MNILFVQLGSMGDCLLATTIARQIKEVDYPNCHLTWMIGDIFETVIKNNPYVDDTITKSINVSRETSGEEKDGGKDKVKRY